MEVLSLGICARTAHPQIRIFVSFQPSWKIFEGTCPSQKRGKNSIILFFFCIFQWKVNPLKKSLWKKDPNWCKLNWRHMFPRIHCKSPLGWRFTLTVTIGIRSANMVKPKKSKANAESSTIFITSSTQNRRHQRTAITEIWKMLNFYSQQLQDTWLSKHIAAESHNLCLICGHGL